MEESHLKKVYDKLTDKPYRFLLLYLIQTGATDPLGSMFNTLAPVTGLMFLGGPLGTATDELTAQMAVLQQEPFRQWFDETAQAVGQNRYCYQAITSEAQGRVSNILFEAPSRVGLSEEEVFTIVNRDGEETARTSFFLFFSVVLAQTLFLTAKHEFRVQYGIKRALFRNKWSLA